MIHYIKKKLHIQKKFKIHKTVITIILQKQFWVPYILLEGIYSMFWWPFMYACYIPWWHKEVGINRLTWPCIHITFQLKSQCSVLPVRVSFSFGLHGSYSGCPKSQFLKLVIFSIVKRLAFLPIIWFKDEATTITVPLATKYQLSGACVYVCCCTVQSQN